MKEHRKEVEQNEKRSSQEAQKGRQTKSRVNQPSQIIREERVMLLNGMKQKYWTENRTERL